MMVQRTATVVVVFVNGVVMPALLLPDDLMCWRRYDSENDKIIES